MYNRRKGIEDKANATYLCTLNKPSEFWWVLLEKMGLTFVHVSLLKSFSFLPCHLSSKVFQRVSQRKKINQGTGNSFSETGRTK